MPLHASPRRPPREQPRIYLDCDGVLADFDAGARAVLGLSPAEYERRHGVGRFWAGLARAPDFFDTLPLMSDALELYDAVRHRSPIILTGVPRGGWAAPQKRRWAARHFPGVEMITTMAALKHEHRHPGDALVDDRIKYRHLWKAEGGIFIHHRDARTSIDELRSLGFL